MPERLIYSIITALYFGAIRLYSLFNKKAGKWVRGRQNIFEKLAETFAGNPKVIWFHCSSLGEFEQGRPLMQVCKKEFPDYKILLTFFSPSGYEIRKNTTDADFVFYLPADSRKNAREFLDLVNPTLCIFIKYEYWYYYFERINNKKIPLLIVSAAFRKNQVFFKWYGGLYREMLKMSTNIFVQNIRSQELLSQIGISENVVVAGDTRFDRVVQIASEPLHVAIPEHFLKNKKIIVAGSTWPADENILYNVMEACGDDFSLILAPHDVSPERIASLRKQFGPRSKCLSELEKTVNIENLSVVIVDSMGVLSKLYRYAYITYIGGGFGKGIHNIAEAVVYGKPVLFGPNYARFYEAIDLLKIDVAYSVNTASDCLKIIDTFNKDAESYEFVCKKATDYIYNNVGAVDKIIEAIRKVV